jgi:hypothetical protein
MERFLFFGRVLKVLDQGKVIRFSITLALRILAIVTILGGLYLLIDMLKLSFRLPTEGTIGGLIFALIFIAAIACVAQVYLYRANSVKELGDSPFTVIPIVSILFRTAGEIYATWFSALGVGGCIFVWFSGFSPMQLLGPLGETLPSAPTGSTFLTGISFLVLCALMAFLGLVAFYFLAEATLVVVDIARNIRTLAAQKGTDKSAAAPVA